MKIRELKMLIANEDDDREVVLHDWNGGLSRYAALEPSPNPNLHANTKNLFVLRDGHNWIKGIRI